MTGGSLPGKPEPSSVSADPIDGSVDDGDKRLRTLGYKKQLTRQVSLVGNMALTLSDITPTATLLVVGPVLILAAGTGSFWVVIIAAVVSLCIAWCIGELGSMYPVAGGLYSITSIVLGRATGFVALIALVVVSCFVPAALVIGVGTYLATFNPNIPTNIAAGVIMAVVTLFALLKIRFNALLTGVFLVIELIIVLALALAGILHLHQSVSVLINPTGPGAGGNSLAPVGLGVIISAVAVAIFALGGYEGAVNFAEETEGDSKNIGTAVVYSYIIGVIFIVIPFVAVILGASSLSAFVRSATPLTDVAKSAFGTTFVDIITAGAIVAIVNAALALVLQYSRVIWASGRDRAWPDPINGWLSLVSPRRGSPWVATLIVGVVGVALCLQSSLVTVVTFASVLYVVSYGLVVVAALVSRVRHRHELRPYRMPFWPIPPIIALIGVAYSISQQSLENLIITVAIFAASLLYYFAFLKPRYPHFWSMKTASVESKSEPVGASDVLSR